MGGNWSLLQAGIQEEAYCELPTLCNEATRGRKNIPCFWLAQIAPIAVLVDCKYGKSASWQPSRHPEIGIKSDGAEQEKLSNQLSFTKKCNVTKLRDAGTR